SAVDEDGYKIGLSGVYEVGVGRRVFAGDRDEIRLSPNFKTAEPTLPSDHFGWHAGHHFDNGAIGKKPVFVLTYKSSDFHLAKQVLAATRSPVGAERNWNPGFHGAADISGRAIQKKLLRGDHTIPPLAVIIESSFGARPVAWIPRRIGESSHDPSVR